MLKIKVLFELLLLKCKDALKVLRQFIKYAFYHLFFRSFA